MQRVFVLDARGEPLMPCHPARARKLLKQGRAVVVHHQPFTIKLLDRVGGATQPVVLKVDPGSQTSGLALVGLFARGAEVLWAGETARAGRSTRLCKGPGCRWKSGQGAARSTTVPNRVPQGALG